MFRWEWHWLQILTSNRAPWWLHRALYIPVHQGSRKSQLQMFPTLVSGDHDLTEDPDFPLSSVSQFGEMEGCPFSVPNTRITSILHHVKL